MSVVQIRLRAPFISRLKYLRCFEAFVISVRNGLSPDISTLDVLEDYFENDPICIKDSLYPQTDNAALRIISPHFERLLHNSLNRSRFKELCSILKVLQRREPFRAHSAAKEEDFRCTFILVCVFKGQSELSLIQAPCIYARFERLGFSNQVALHQFAADGL